MIFRLTGLPAGIAVMDVLADVDAVDDEVAGDVDCTFYICRCTAAGIAGRQTCGIGQQPVYRRITRDFSFWGLDIHLLRRFDFDFARRLNDHLAAAAVVRDDRAVGKPFDPFVLCGEVFIFALSG